MRCEAAPRAAPEADITRFLHVLLVIYFAEVGLVLTVAPWTVYWDRNYFVESLPILQAVLTSHVVRGAVTGVGVLSVGAAVVDLAAGLSRVCSRPAARAGGSLWADAARHS